MNKRKEKISAFLDNDMHRDELMSFSLSAESDDVKTAQRYQMMGDALRGEMSESSFIDVSHAVREALVNENIGDEIAAAKAESLSGQISEPLSGKQGFFNVSAWFRPVAGMAVAASVAVVMVVTLSAQDSGGLAPVAVNIDQQPVVQQPVVRVAVEDKSITDKNIDNKAAKNIDQRLVNQHLEFATQDALQGRLPYARAVSFESKK
ncbi:MAG: sigma-E factor negative regulatory protein [Gammaproteobacteria bacterium]